MVRLNLKLSSVGFEVCIFALELNCKHGPKRICVVGSLFHVQFLFVPPSLISTPDQVLA